MAAADHAPEAAPLACRPLIEIGATLAALADPKPIDDLAGEIGEIASDLQYIDRGILAAIERAEERYDGIADRQGANAARAALEADVAAARGKALRAAKRALINLARVIGEMEAPAGPRAA